jgi:hypothetical protein
VHVFNRKKYFWLRLSLSELDWRAGHQARLNHMAHRLPFLLPNSVGSAWLPVRSADIFRDPSVGVRVSHGIFPGITGFSFVQLLAKNAGTVDDLV